MNTALDHVDQLREILEHLKLYATIEAVHGDNQIVLRKLSVDRTPVNQLPLFPKQNACVSKYAPIREIWKKLNYPKQPTYES